MQTCINRQSCLWYHSYMHKRFMYSSIYTCCRNDEVTYSRCFTYLTVGTPRTPLCYYILTYFNTLLYILTYFNYFLNWHFCLFLRGHPARPPFYYYLLLLSFITIFYYYLLLLSFITIFCCPRVTIKN